MGGGGGVNASIAFCVKQTTRSSLPLGEGTGAEFLDIGWMQQLNDVKTCNVDS